MDGLHGILAASDFAAVTSSVLHPSLALASAASHPAWPAPITITSRVILVGFSVQVSGFSVQVSGFIRLGFH
jgi:hypothetical protein